MDAGYDVQPSSDASSVQDGPDAGPKFVLVSDPGAPSDLAIDSDYVYWTSYASGTIQRVSKAGGAAQPLASIQRFGNPSLDVDDTSVYFTAFDDSGVTMYVGAIPKSGGKVSVIAGQQYTASHVRVKDGFVYWVTGAPSSGGGIARASVTNGSVQTLTPTTYISVGRLCVDDQNVYWTDEGDLGPTSGHAYRTLRDGTGQVVTLGSDLDSPYGIAVDASMVFVATGAHSNPTNGNWNGAILSLNKSAPGLAATTTLASNQAVPLAIALDDVSVYWGDHLAGYVMKITKTGGSAVPVIFTGASGFESIAVDDQYVYWIFSSVGNGYVGRAPKSP